MNIFNIFNLKNSQVSPKIEKEQKPQNSADDNNIGLTIAKCPYCKEQLLKFPGSKTKCKHCGNYMFVRTRPADKKRVVVTKEDATRIEELWSIVYGTHELFLENKSEYENERIRLRTKFGREPSDADIKWAILNKRTLKYASEGSWGLYRNNILDMGDVVRREMKFDYALAHYLEVCYLDLNGPENSNGQGPAFDPTSPTASLAPGVIEYIVLLSNKLGYNLEKIKELYFSVAERTYNNLRLPLNPVKTWQKLENHLANIIQ